jgi:co-chaperonin GroES (HSP10)
MSYFNIRGYRILLEVDSVQEEITEGSLKGFQMIHNEKDKRIENSGQQTGKVLGIGATCWTDATGNPMVRWCEVGDKILFSKHAARFIYTPGEDDVAPEEYAVINDTDVIAVVGED